jgi:hypothetical protein
VNTMGMGTQRTGKWRGTVLGSDSRNGFRLLLLTVTIIISTMLPSPLSASCLTSPVPGKHCSQMCVEFRDGLDADPGPPCMEAPRAFRFANELGWVGVRLYWKNCLKPTKKIPTKALQIQAVDEDGFPIGFFNGNLTMTSPSNFVSKCRRTDPLIHASSFLKIFEFICPRGPNWRSNFHVRHLTLYYSFQPMTAVYSIARGLSSHKFKLAN